MSFLPTFCSFCFVQMFSLCVRVRMVDLQFFSLMVMLAEHSDGSLLFRFGNPSEVAENVKIEESSAVVEMETEGTDEYSQEDEMSNHMENSIEAETNSAPINSKTIIAVEEENISIEDLSKGSDDFELLVSIANEEVEVGVEEEDAGDLENGADEKHVDSSPADTAVLDKHSEEENTVYVEDFSRDETDDVAKLDVDVAENDVFPESQESIVSLDKSSSSELKNAETVIISEFDEGSTATAEGDPVPSDLDMNPSDVIEEQILQSGQDSIAGEGSGSVKIDHISPNEQNVMIDGPKINKAEETEPVSNSIVAEDQASGADTELPSVIAEDITENGELQSPVVLSQMEAVPILEDTMNMSTEDNGEESHISRDDLVEASAYEGTEIKAAESAPMSEEVFVSDLALFSGAALLPHPSKVLSGGEDAYFIAGQTWMGVADGVGLWSLEGTRPGVFAKELTRTCERLVSVGNINNPVELLDLSASETHCPGSSTILIAHFDGQTLNVANVGNSGFIILRNGTVYKRSSPMFHAFYFPLQVEGGEEPSRMAELYRVDLEDDDVIVIATDGLLDNLYDLEISSVVSKSLAADKKLEEIAKLLAESAQERGRCAHGRSPFADEAQAAGYTGCTGGKLDDVAVILSVVRLRRPEAGEGIYL
ncbi:probable protein phosphatase 2C 71 isoform X2 [Andrographis paniculata]|uniref:probable protein phosphatase 2C 71 isoform X2 n=1 Tax=Andrographis paniculata TaxID=175694 RepID=UPI0021E8ED27|nr:probable protein phosphatase 2C 71 isoform X2 [Andrographis paniculata]